MSIKNFLNYLIFGKISLGLKDQPIFEEKATDENSIRYHLTTKLKTRDKDASSEAMCQVGRDIGYMAMMFPFSPPVENNNTPPAMEEISDRFGAQNNRLTQVRGSKTNVKRKSDVMLSEDEPLFKLHKHFASVLTVDPTTELKISLDEPPTTNNIQPAFVVMRSAPVDIPKRRIQPHIF